MKVIFFNHYHNGDLHTSRQFIRNIIAVIRQQDHNTSFTYSHHNHPTLLADIPHLCFDPSPVKQMNDYDTLIRSGDIVYINTWLGQNHRIHLNQYGITLDTLYIIFDNICKQLWRFSLTDISSNPADFIPTIDYSKFQVSACQEWLANHSGKKVLVENGNAMSGQSYNFAMKPIIIEVASRHPDYTFILTKVEAGPLPNNVIYSTNIIQKIGSDLNEVSFLSTYCDVIIGRASGVFSFTLTQENLFHRQIKYLCFSNLVPLHPNKFFLGTLLQDKINYTSNILTSDEKNVNKIQDIIESNL